MIKSILVGMDGSPQAGAARDDALRLARAYEARVVGVHVLDVRLIEMPPYLEYSYEGIPLIPMPTEILEGFREKGERVLQEFHRGCEDCGAVVESRLEEGVPAETIAELGRTHDLIVLGKRGEHARWGKDLLGSTSESVVRQASTPVWLSAEESRPTRAVLTLFDGSPPAGRALRLAADIASTLQASLRVLTVGEDEAEAGAVQEGARAYLDAFDLSTEFRVAAGEVVTATLEHLEEEPVDLVVMGKQGHSLIRRLILGSTSEQLMREISGPVLLA
jgi:nucleotide-binding universal stress UspA family protein